MTQLEGRIAPRVPASMFGIVLGLAGLSNIWRGAHALWGLPATIEDALFFVAAAAWLVIAALYTLKWLQAREAALLRASILFNAALSGSPASPHS